MDFVSNLKESMEFVGGGYPGRLANMKKYEEEPAARDWHLQKNCFRN